LGDESSKALRPIRLQGPAIKILKDLFREQMIPYFFLEKAPLLQSWSEVGTLSREGFFDSETNVDRWVEEQELCSKLREVFEHLGGRVVSEPLQRMPKGKGTAMFEVVDFDPREIETDMRTKFFPQLERRPLLQSYEIWMPFAKDIYDEPSFEFTKIEASLALSETHPKSGRVITLFASSQYSLQRALRALKDPRGHAPTSWKARVLAEGGGAHERNYSYYWGTSGFYRPGVWPMGRALGSLHPVHNLQGSDSLRQAERLYQEYMKLPRGESLLLAADDWRRREKLRLLKELRRSQFTERLLFSSRCSSIAQRMSQLLPPIVRQSLKTPI